MTTLRLNKNYPSLFNNFFNEYETLASPNFKSLPSVNILEKEDSFILELAVPGLKKEDFKINFHENKLTISAEKKIENSDSAQKYTKKEFSYNQFQRTFNLPQIVDIDKIGATYLDGILLVSIPKKEEAKAKEPKLIEVV